MHELIKILALMCLDYRIINSILDIYIVCLLRRVKGGAGQVHKSH